ncbi:MAG: hypothetical protein IKH55_00875 [Fibrobacter sp.]|nr:hypothetical protein [Fibrobacter sp.]
MICPKCGEKYEDDMPRCLWCDAPNPDHAAAMERLKAEEKAEQVRLQELREKNKEKFREELKGLKKDSVGAVKEIGNAAKDAAKDLGNASVGAVKEIGNAAKDAAKDLGNASVDAVKEIGKSSLPMLKGVGKFLLFVVVILPNILLLNRWLSIIFDALFPYNLTASFFMASSLSIVFWSVIVGFQWKRWYGCYLGIVMLESEAMILITVVKIIKKIAEIYP